MGIRILTTPRRLAHSGPVRGGTTFTQKPSSSANLERLGLRVNFAKSALSPSQRVSFLGTVLDSARMRAVIAPERALAIQKLAATFKSDTARHSKCFRECWPYGRSITSVTAGPAPHAPPSTLVETTVPHNAWRHGRLHIRVNQACVTALTPWKNPRWMKKGVAMGLVHTRKVVTTDASNTGWGALCEGGEGLPHQLLGNASSLSSLPVFPAGPNRTPCADSLRQHVRGVLYKSPGRCLLEAPLYSGRAPSGMGSAQPALAEAAHTCGQTEPRIGYVYLGASPLRGVMLHPQVASEDLEDLWQGRKQGRPFRLSKTTLTCPTYYSKGQGRVGPRPGPPPPLCIPSNRPASTGRQRVRDRVTRCYWWPPLWGNHLGCRADSATDSSLPVPLKRDLLSQANGTIWHPRPPSCGLSTFGRSTGAYRPPRASVINTISEARAPSTRTPLYALKCLFFLHLVASTGVMKNPSTSELAVVLSFCRNC